MLLSVLCGTDRGTTPANNKVTYTPAQQAWLFPTARLISDYAYGRPIEPQLAAGQIAANMSHVTEQHANNVVRSIPPAPIDYLANIGRPGADVLH